MKKRLSIPQKLVVVALASSLSACPGSGEMKQSQVLCPPDYFCTSDAARAFNCTDMSPDPFQSDLGSCFPPI